MTNTALARHWLQQFVGMLLLMLLVWGFLNTPDQRIWNLLLSALLAILAVFTAAWLTAANFSGATRPTALRLGWSAALVVGLLILLLLVSLAQDRYMWKAAIWIASDFSLRVKKPLAPLRAYEAVGWFADVISYVLLPLICLYFLLRRDPATSVRFLRLAAIYCGAFLLGLVIPHYLVHWVPKIPGFWPQLISAVFRFALAYALLITAWVMLGHLVRPVAPSQSN